MWCGVSSPIGRAKLMNESIVDDDEDLVILNLISRCLDLYSRPEIHGFPMLSVKTQSNYPSIDYWDDFDISGYLKVIGSQSSKLL